MRLSRLLPATVTLAACFGLFMLPSTGWSTDPTASDAIREEDRLGARSDRYSRVFDKAISALVAGDAATKAEIALSNTAVAVRAGP